MNNIDKVKNILFKTRKRKIIVALVVFLLIGWKLTGGSKQQPQYQTTRAEKGTLVVSVSESGQALVANRVAVTTGANGIVNHVYVKSGDTVSAGQTIADLTLDIAGAQKQAQALATYMSAKNSLDSANANLNSLQSKMFVANQAFLNDKGSSSTPSDAQKADPKYIEENADWLAAEANYKNQQSVISQAQIAVSNAWLSYETVSSNIVAPLGGSITDLTIAPGMQLGGAEVSGGLSGTTLTTIANIKSDGLPTISVSLSEVDAVKVKTGEKATITFDAIPNTTFTGRVLGINSTGTVAQGVTSYPATITLDTPSDKILPNMSVTANIILDVRDNVLLVPSAAVQTSSGQTTVRVMKNNAVTPFTVEVGESSDTQTEIISGLSEGDTVVTGVVSAATQQSGSGSQTASPFGVRFGGFGGGGVRGGGGGR